MTRLVVFLMALEVFNNESVNSIFKYKIECKFEYKLGGFNIKKKECSVTICNILKYSWNM